MGNERLYKLIAPAVEALGYTLWGIETLPQRGILTLRVYIDADNGISIDDCEAASRQVSAILDVENPISGEYVLEVSSPGLDRPLFCLAQYTDYCGQVLKLRLRTAIKGRRKFKGELQAIEGQELKFGFDNEVFIIDFDNIEKANVVGRFDNLGA